MNFFIDTEFIEGAQTKKFLGIPYGKTKPTIDLISIGIVAEDGREYYAISKEFNLEEAWNRHDLKIVGKRDGGMTPIYEKEYWLRKNVLTPIFDELEHKDYLEYSGKKFIKKINFASVNNKKSFNELKKAINRYGKTNKQIAEEVRHFVLRTDTFPRVSKEINPIFYGYYADYDWVVFAWLFGLMKDLPKGFPYYCRDLKQTLDERGNPNILHLQGNNEHNALNDARYHKRIYDFLHS